MTPAPGMQVHISLKRIRELHYAITTRRESELSTFEHTDL